MLASSVRSLPLASTNDTVGPATAELCVLVERSGVVVVTTVVVVVTAAVVVVRRCHCSGSAGVVVGGGPVGREGKE